MTAFQFDASRVVPDSGIPDPIPAGWYVAAIDQSELKATGDGQGRYIEFRYNIAEGQYVGRKLFARLNVQNANNKTVEIAYGQLSAICHAVNKLMMQQLEDLHGIPHKVKVTVNPARTVPAADGSPGKSYEASNEIRGFKHVSEVTDSKPAGPGQPSAAGFPAAPQAMQPQAPAGWAGAPQAAPQPMQAPQQFAPQQAPQGGQPWAQQPQGGQPQPWAQQPQQQPAPQMQQPAPQQAQQPQPWAQQPQAQAQPPQGSGQPGYAQNWQGQPPQAAPQPAPGQFAGAPAAGGADLPPWARPA